MKQYIDKSALVVELERLISNGQVKLQESQESNDDENYIVWSEHIATCIKVLSLINTLEVIDPYEQCVQYDSIKAGIQAHAETYSFNIESKLFNQLTKEQQELWRKEIEQACISGGEAGVELAKDPRYKETLEVEENDLVEELDYDDYMTFFEEHPDYIDGSWGFEETWTFGQYCYKLGLKAQKRE
jgi:hypothetical protein